MFDHVSIRVSDLQASRRFYELAMKTLGFGEPATDGEHFECCAVRDVRERMRVFSHEDGAGDVLRGAVFADCLGDG